MRIRRLTRIKPVVGFAALAALAGAGAAAQAPLLFDLPIACEVGRTCFLQNYVDIDPGPGAKDYRGGAMTYDAHNGLDIRLPTLAAQRAGVEVRAAAAGVVRATRDGAPDISTRTGGPVAADRMCGNGVVLTHPGGIESQYCHMARGSIAVKASQPVAAGQALGRVGLSGNTEFPHLHFEVRRAGQKLDLFREELWSPKARAALAYRAPLVINIGFAAAAVTDAQIDEAAVAPPGRSTPLVFYARAIGLSAGDMQKLTILGPSGQTVVESIIPPLDRPKAQYFAFAGDRNGGRPWAGGTYRGRYEVLRGGAVVLREERSLGL
jgi:murein DD-endopeptidase MepM/ murein hydrolase activator NlpD